MGVKEYKYLCDALKVEILTLRGDLKKSNLPIHIVTDKKVLQFLPQDALIGEDGNELGGDNTSLSGSDSTQNLDRNRGNSKGNLQLRKRVSLLNLDEEQMILKYCELKAKYDNLMESSSKKIYELTTAKDLVIAQQQEVVSSKEDKELIKKYEEVMEDKDKVIYDLKSKIKDQESEIEGTQQMMECNMADIKNLEERIDKHSKYKY